MSHKALARKHRPRSFAEVSTQEHVSETLRRAVASDRVGHAYLFCGPRGVGKTTLARVLAMALNCPNRGDDGEPCGTCESCTRIWGGHTALDVVEIDAASNRGVDDARDLRERAMYAPSADGRTKVYIVDEAHMLTREAWNALLKILEEPPPRVIFVFATTEPQKIQQLAAPILSRCQRFDFRRIGVADIVAQLGRVLSAEGGDASEDALRVIARKADGGMRDALSLLDQVLSLTGGEVDLDSVRRVLGLVEEERYVELLDILSARRHEEIFGLVQRLVDEGYDLTEFYHGLLDVLRVLLRLRLAPDADVDVQEDVRAQLTERAVAFAPGDLVRMLSAAAELESQGSLRRSPNPRLPIEMLLLRMSFLDRTVSLEELIGALGGPAAPSAPGSASGGSPSPGTPAASEPSSQRGQQSAGTGPETKGAPEAKRVGASGSQAKGNLSTSVGENPVGDPERGGLARALRLAAGTEEEAPVVTETPEASVEAQPAPIEASEDIEEAWSRWLEDGRGVPHGLLAFLRSSSVAADDRGRLVLRPLPGPARERLESEAVLGHLTDALSPYLTRRPAIVLGPPLDASDSGARATREEVRGDTLRALIRQEPRLERAVQELDLELMD